jgi:hypothetical protein
MPPTEGDLRDLIRDLAGGTCEPLGVTVQTESPPVIVYIEDVRGSFGKQQPGARMFTFGRSYGGLVMACMMVGLAVHEVRPLVWQKALGLHRKKTQAPPAWKNRLKGLAQKLYPELKVTLETADALLILEYARRREGQ